MSRILIIEDELPMRTALADTLGDEGHRILTAADGLAGLERAVKEKPDLILLDVMMPQLDGYALCRELRRLGLVMPLLMLTAKGHTDDKVTGLDAGADDYLVKPFQSRELLARVRALLRRAPGAAALPDTFSFGDIQLNFARNDCRKQGRPVSLTPKEMAMLRLLCARPGEVVTRDEFLDQVWGYGGFPVTRTVDNHIARLRSKLETDPSLPKHVLTANKAGYRLER